MHNQIGHPFKQREQINKCILLIHNSYKIVSKPFNGKNTFYIPTETRF